MTGRVSCFAPCPRGVEALLADELRRLGVSGVRPQRGGVLFSGPLLHAYRVLLWSRLASRVLLSLGSVSAESADTLYEGVRRDRVGGPRACRRHDRGRCVGGERRAAQHAVHRRARERRHRRPVPRALRRSPERRHDLARPARERGRGRCRRPASRSTCRASRCTAEATGRPACRSWRP